MSLNDFQDSSNNFTKYQTKHLTFSIYEGTICFALLKQFAVEPGFNEVAGDRQNLFVKIEGSLYRKPLHNEFEGKRLKCSLYRGIVND